MVNPRLMELETAKQILAEIFHPGPLMWEKSWSEEIWLRYS
jgi:hypothetical protein